MTVGGILKNSLIDYPGHPAMVVFTQGCDWSCPFCHNPSLIPRHATSTLPIDTVIDCLRKRPSQARNLVVTGGEPTIHDDLADLLCSAKQVGARIKLDTNGNSPDFLDAIIAGGMVDYVALDLKGPLLCYAKFVGRWVDSRNLGRSIHILKDSSVEHEFRTTVVPALHAPEDFDAIGQTLEGGRRLFLQAFRREGVLGRRLRQSAEPSADFLNECAARAGKYLPVRIR